MEEQNNKIRIIAEAASNHRGDIARAVEMVWQAKEAGCSFIKFQSWQSRNLNPGDPDIEYFKKRELKDEDHFKLIEECKKAGIEFLTACFDSKRIEFLASLGIKKIKVPSQNCGNLKMLEKLENKFDYLIISTGMSLSGEVEKAAKLLSGRNFAFLHCVSLYPTPPEKVNLKRMDWLRKFTPDVGFSDHTVGPEAAKAAMAMGAKFIEKHFDLEANPRKLFEATPEQLKELVDYARLVEILKGAGLSEMQANEEETRKKYLGRLGK